MKTCFCTLATGEYYEKGGTQNLIKSAKKFYPNIPFYVFGDKEVQEVLNSYQEVMNELVKQLDKSFRPSPPFLPLEMNFYHAFLGRSLCKKYDLVIYMDCDSLIVAPLTEVFEEDYEVAGVRNTADNGKAGFMEVVIDGGLDKMKYINGGFTACRKPDFWDNWALMNLGVRYNSQLAEQYTLNVLFHSGIYKSLLLDSVEKDVYYGNSSTYGTKTHWDSWQNIVVENNLLKLNNKTIKILHEAGGTHLPKMDLDSDLLPLNVRNWIKEYILEI